MNNSDVVSTSLNKASVIHGENKKEFRHKRVPKYIVHGKPVTKMQYQQIKNNQRRVPPKKNDKETLPDEKEINSIIQVLRSNVIADNNLGLNDIKKQMNFDVLNSKTVAKKSYYDMIHDSRIPISVRMPYLRSSVTTIHVNNEEQSQFFKQYTTKKIVVNKEFNGHPHLMLNQIRRDIETDITIDKFPLRVFDIGAGCRSLKWGLNHVFSNQPILSSCDRFREESRLQAAMINHMEENRCKCKVQDCTHFKKIMESNPFQIIMSIDSAYYDGVMKFIEDNVKEYGLIAYIAVHVFDRSHFIKEQKEFVVQNSKEKEKKDDKIEEEEEEEEEEDKEEDQDKNKPIIDNIEICGSIEGNVTITKVDDEEYVIMNVNGNQCSYYHKPFIYNDEAFDKNYFVKNGKAYMVAKRYVLSDWHHIVLLKCCSEYVEYGDCYNNRNPLDQKLPNQPKLTHEQRVLQAVQDIQLDIEVHKVIKNEPNYIKIPKDRLVEKYDEEALSKGDWLVVYDEVQKRNRYYKLVNKTICEMYVMQHRDNGIYVTKEQQQNVKGVIELAALNKMVKFILNQSKITYQSIKTLVMQYLSKNDACYDSVMALVTSALEQALEYEKKIKMLYETRVVKDINDFKNSGAKIINLNDTLTLRERVSNIFTSLSLERRIFYNNKVLPFLAFLVSLFFLTGFYMAIAAKIYYVIYLIRILLQDSTFRICWSLVKYFKKSIFFYLIKILARIMGLNIPFVTAMVPDEQSVVSQVTIPGVYLILKLFKKPINWLLGKLAQPFQQIRIPASCISASNYKEVSLPTSKYVEWHIKNPLTNEPISDELSLMEFMDLKNTCPFENNKLFDEDEVFYGDETAKMASVVPIFKDCEEPICYHICPANNYCAIKRQCTAVIEPDDDMLEEFKEWFNTEILPDIKMFLSDFHYNYMDWYLHLPSNKRSEINEYIDLIKEANGDMETLQILAKQKRLKLDNEFDMFVKCEKQLKENGQNPKNRCIAGAKPMHKVVLGPVTWQLEKYFKNYFPGYCGGKNWEQMEEMINNWHQNGFNDSLQLDGSGFDRTQHIKIKEIVDFQIYKLIESKINHVPLELFQEFAYSTKKRVNVKSYHNGTEYDCGYVIIEGTVLSGSMDTTLMNTIRMALYNRFVNEYKAGLDFGLDYECIAKGDDTVAVYQPWVSKKLVQDSYDKVFFKKNAAKEEDWINISHGLGQIAKFYHWGPLCDIDFCSVSVFYIPKYDAYRMTRKLDRFLTLTGYTTKCLGELGTLTHALYTQALFIANNVWLKNLPIFRTYNLLFRKQLPKLASNVSKKVKAMYDAVQQLEIDPFASIDIGFFMGTDFKYKMYNNVTTPRNNDYYVVEAFYDDLLYRYDISREEANQLEEDIMNYNSDGYIYSSIIDKIINHKQHYRSWEEYEANDI